MSAFSIQVFEEKVSEGIIKAKEPSPKDKVVPLRPPQSRELNHIREFWNKSSRLKPGDCVCIPGQLSIFGPFLMAPPEQKRWYHKLYRMGKIQGMAIDGPSVDALMAFTAGQMVFRNEAEEEEWVYLGLYQSIVRNSIPIFVEKNYYRNEIKSYFFGEEGDRFVVEAKVTGIVREVEDRIKSFVESFLKNADIDPRTYGISDDPVFALYIIGENDDTGIEVLSKAPRYLDGDIWAAVETADGQSFVGRFVDLADPLDYHSELKDLKKEIEEKRVSEGLKLLFQFDQVLRPLGG